MGDGRGLDIDGVVSEFWSVGGAFFYYNLYELIFVDPYFC